MTNGKSFVIRLADPVRSGDSGHVDVFLSASAHVNAEDSIRFAREGNLRKQMTLRRAGAGVYRAFVLKAASGWIVTRVVTRSVT